MPSEKINGSASLQSKRLHDLTVNGSAALEDVTVDGQLKIYGSVSSESCNFYNAEIHGSAAFEDVRVAKSLIVHGSYAAEHSDLEDVVIYGSSNFAHCDIQGTCNLTGSADLEHSEVHHGITFLGAELTIASTVVHGNISVVKRSWFWSLFQSQKIKVSHAELWGDIVFEAPGGRVEMDRSSKIHGKVINGSVVSA